MSRKKKPSPEDEPRIHRVDSDEGLHHDHVQITCFDQDEEEQEDLPDFATTPKLTWESEKDSITTLEIAYEKIHGVRLRPSDLYKIMYTSAHMQVVKEYLETL